MPPKNKFKRGTAPQTNKKGKSAPKKKQQPPHLPPPDAEAWTMDDKEEPSLKSVMALLGSMKNRMGTYEKSLEEMTADPSPPLAA